MDLFDVRSKSDSWVDDWIRGDSEQEQEELKDTEEPKRCLACFFAPCRCKEGLKHKK